MKLTILAFDGTESVGATEWEMTNDAAFAAQASTVEGEWQANLDLNNLTGTENLTFRVYEKMRTSASAQRLMYEEVFVGGGTLKGYQSPKFTLGNGWAMTLTMTTGSARTVIWSIHRWQSSNTEAAMTTAQADLDDIQTRLPAALVSGRMDSSVGAMAAAVLTATSIATDAFSSAKFAASGITKIAAGVWDALTSGLTTSGSIGKLLVDDIDATISSRASQTSVNTIDDFLDTEIASIQADTDDIQTRLPAALVSGRMDSSVGAMAANVITAAAAAADFGTEVATAVWAATTRLLTAGTNIVLAKGTGVTGLNDLDAAGVRGAVGLASANLDTQLDALPTNAELATALGTADDAVLAQVALVKAKTDNLPSDPADASDIAASFTTLSGKVDVIDDFLDTEIAAIKAKTDNLPSDPADASDIAALFAALPSAASITTAVWGAASRLLTAGTNIVLAKGTGVTGFNDLDAAGVRGAVGLASANLDTQLDALPTNAELATALGTADDAVLSAIDDIPDAIFDAADAVETGLTFRQALRAMSAVLFGKVSGAHTGTETFRSAVADDTDRVVSTDDSDGNRTNVTTDL